MKHLILSFLLIFPASLFAQFDGIVGTDSCKAIHCDDARFVEWAAGCSITRGYLNIANQPLGVASYGTEIDAVGKVTESTVDVVSLGDGGAAILTFTTPIANGEGTDFAVFENALNDDFLELAFVEASSDGVHYFRFPAVSNTQAETQIGTYGTLDASKLHNLAGKYRVGWGVPFDLSDLPNDENLDKNNINYIKIIDVVGTINPEFASHDNNGNIINDPYPTAFASGGFDLAGVGVINNQNTMSVADIDEMQVSVFPNPTSDYLRIINYEFEIKNVRITDISGKIIYNSSFIINNSIDVSGFANGIYFVELKNNKTKKIIKIIKN